MSDIEELSIHRDELETMQTLLDQVSSVGRKAGSDIVRTNRFDDPEDIAWAFLAVSELAERLRHTTIDAKARAVNEPLIEEKLYHEMKEQMYQWMRKAEVMEAQLAVQKKHTGWAKTWATVWKRAAKENRSLYLMSRSSVEAWKKYATGLGDKPNVVDETTE